MIEALLVWALGLGLPGLLPGLLMGGLSPAAVFLAPLLGAVMAAVAAELVLALPGTMVAWYLAVVVTVNVAAGSMLWKRGRWVPAGRFSPSRRLLTVLVIAAALAVPLTGLRTAMVGFDANAIWLTHALMISGGHHALLSGIQNPAYRFSNPDYPPLVPSIGALALGVAGRARLHVAVDVTALLNASAVGLAALGVATVGFLRGGRARAAALVAGGLVCLDGFAAAGNGGVNGYADLLWAAAAVAAIVWGLVLPKGRLPLAVALCSAAVAALTKNEGLTTALVTLVMIALRYHTPRYTAGAAPELAGTFAGHRRRPRPTDRAVALSVTMVVVALPALPGLAWQAMVRLLGVGDVFLASPPVPIHPSARVGPTLSAMLSHLAVAPAALAAVGLGAWLLPRARARLGLGSPGWLWLAGSVATAIIVATYVFGPMPIQWWLQTSMKRTMIFPQLLLVCELAIWGIVALDPRPRSGPGSASDARATRPVPRSTSRVPAAGRV